MKKRLLCLLLVLVTALALCVSAAAAAQTRAQPYRISTPAHWEYREAINA